MCIIFTIVYHPHCFFLQFLIILQLKPQQNSVGQPIILNRGRQVGHVSNVGGVTAGQARHNSSTVGGFTAGQVRHNSSIYH